MSTITHLEQLLEYALINRASDLYLSWAQSPYPYLRIDGEVIKVIEPAATEAFRDPDSIFKALTKHLPCFLDRAVLSCDFSIQSKNARFRVNCFHQIDGPVAVLRPIPESPYTLDELGAPAALVDIVQAPRGFVLMCGVTGSGKSTTQAAMIEYLNCNTRKHIILLEEPIEQKFHSKNCLIHQREVGTHCDSFNDGLRGALRESPDVIVIGELRDLETIRLALSAAETGHLVLATLHAMSAAKAIDRLVEGFPETEKSIVRAMLSTSLHAVISQRLFKRLDTKGRIAAHEIMLATPAIRNLIREGKIEQIESQIQTGKKYGMTTFTQSIERLVSEKKIRPEVRHEITAASFHHFTHA